MKKLVVASNTYNEIEQLDEWYAFVKEIADGGILIVDTGSTDGTAEFFKDKPNTVIIKDDIITREGYGPARTHLRNMSRKHFPDAEWMIYLDQDERILPSEFHKLRWIKDSLIDDYDVIAFPRVDFHDKEMTHAENDYVSAPDYQARMSRLTSHNIRYERMLHEQVVGCKKMYVETSTPKINHFHRCTDKAVRRRIGMLCAHLHMSDQEHGDSYPLHPAEQKYRDRIEKEGFDIHKA